MKIIQILQTQKGAIWERSLLIGLADTGNVFFVNENGEWELLVKNTFRGEKRVYEEKTPQSKVKESKVKNIVTFDEDSIEFRLANFLYEKILENNPNHKKPNIKSWALHIDKMIRIDKRKPEEIKKVISWCQKDTFWSANILSTNKLRKQYDQLIMKMNKTKKSKSSNSPGSAPVVSMAPKWFLRGEKYDPEKDKGE
jgi:hypothetical protein